MMKFFKKDKLQHFTISLLMVVAFSLLLGIKWGIIIAFSIGIAKEVIWDLWLKKGTFDIKDIYANLSGIVFGILLLIKLKR